MKQIQFNQQPYKYINYSKNKQKNFQAILNEELEKQEFKESTNYVVDNLNYYTPNFKILNTIYQYLESQ